MTKCSLLDLYFPFQQIPLSILQVSNKLNNLPIRIHTTVFFVDLFISIFFSQLQTPARISKTTGTSKATRTATASTLSTTSRTASPTGKLIF